LLKRSGKVFVTIVPDYSKGELMPILQGKIWTGSTIHTDGWKAYDGLVLNGYDHYRVFHSENEFDRKKIIGTESDAFGALLRESWLNLTIVRLNIWSFLWKNSKLDWIIVEKILLFW
jgi:hypothetical protein